MTERIRSKFHYAVAGDAGFTIFRSDDGVFVEHHSIIIGRPLDRSDMERELALCDGTATHFIQLGEAQALERVNGLAEEAEGFAATYNPLTKRWNVGGLWMGDTFTEALESATTTTEPGGAE